MRRRNIQAPAVVEAAHEQKVARPTPTKRQRHAPLQYESYSVSKWVMLRLVALIYFVAFLGAYFQNEGLMGSYGLQPAGDFMERLHENYPNKWEGFFKHPTLFFWVDLNDEALYRVYGTGILLSALALVGVNSWLLQFLLWLLYFSVVTIASATSFYSYGWESQLLETGFLSIFLCALPHFDASRRIHFVFYESSKLQDSLKEPSTVVLWLFQWLCFRISIGAGLIKIRGSSCWTEKTCLHYHFETQPIPSPLSFLYHFLPTTTQSLMVDVDLWVQVYTSWFVLFPVRALGSWPAVIHTTTLWISRLGGFVQAGFMVGILLSGNFAFLNHLTIVPALACLDDCCWPSTKWLRTTRGTTRSTPGPRRWIDWLLFFTVMYLSVPVLRNLLQWGGSRQQMNATFDSFRLVNTYGAFGSVGLQRFEPIIMIGDGLDWVELEFPCKPGDVSRRPCFSAPYHHRADWNIWFLGFKPHKAYLHRREQWVFQLLLKILGGDTATKRPWLNLLDQRSASYLQDHYYKVDAAPKYAKVDMYHYRMVEPLWTIAWKSLLGQEVQWWERRFEEALIEPVTLDASRRQLQVVQA